MNLAKSSITAEQTLCEYELIREKNIREIKEAMASTLNDITSQKQTLSAEPPTNIVKNKKRANSYLSIQESSRFLRPRKPLSYRELSDMKLKSGNQAGTTFFFKKNLQYTFLGFSTERFWVKFGYFNPISLKYW